MLHTSASLHFQRQGVILLVVVSLLTLFAIIGLSFVMYAESEAKGSQFQREAQVQFRPEIEPDLLAAFALGQLICDVDNNEPGVYSAMRGHSLARSMYGWNDSPGAANIIPFNGVGRLRYSYPNDIRSPFPGLENQLLVNYTFFRGLGDLRLRDPERLGERIGLVPYGPGNAYTGGFNVPYTYPDLNNMFLAAVKADGTVLIPSFHRDWTGFGPLNPSNWRWTSNRQNPGDPDQPWLKYLVLRPRPFDNRDANGNFQFPLPEDATGDVKQLVGAPGGNDSFWMDLGFPTRRTPEGVKYKPLFAFLVTDLDNRVNLNVHGNIRTRLSGNAQYPNIFQNRSHMGWGPWEVNPGQVLRYQVPVPVGGVTLQWEEWTNLFAGDRNRGWTARYGANGQPTVGETASVGRIAHFYGQADYDASRVASMNYSASGPLQLPAGPFAFPTFQPGSGWDNGYDPGGAGEPNEQLNHPLLFNVLNNRPDDRRFAVSNMEALLRYSDTGSSALTSELFQLCPENFQRDARARNLVTVRSFDVDRPGVTPWLWHANLRPYTVRESLPNDDNDEDNPPAPGPENVNFAFPDPLVDRQQPYEAGDEFNPVDWRSLTAALGRVDLNRALAPYPHQGSKPRPPFGNPILTVDPQGRIHDPYGRFDDNNGPKEQQYRVAMEQRQQLARDIYRRLREVTGVVPPSLPNTPDDAELRVRRWLAQVAVNIVDFIDEDEISTPFMFYDEGTVDINETTRPDSVIDARFEQAAELQFPKYWVFGTELPRLVLNEVMVQTYNSEPTYDSGGQNVPVRVFLELHNPFPANVSQTVQQHDSLPVPLCIRGATPYAPYQLLVASRREPPPQQSIIPIGLNNDNILGCPPQDQVRLATHLADFNATANLIEGGAQPLWPAGGRFTSVASPYVPPYEVNNLAAPRGTFLMGPGPVQAGMTGADELNRRDPLVVTNNGEIPRGTPVRISQNLQFDRTFAPNADNDERRTGLVVVLRRLANPHMPFDGVRGTGNTPNPRYNPYITIDYLDRVPLRGVHDGNRAVPSRGKRQPYTSHHSHVVDQPVNPAIPERLQHTFGKLNLPMPNGDKYDWLVHHDRQLVSPFELLHVSGYQPYKLTQRFMFGNDKRAHCVDWFDSGLNDPQTSRRLFRALEFLGTGSRAAGVVASGRIPGKININTVWDEETIWALLDVQEPNSFNSANPNSFARRVYQTMALARTPTGVPTANDRPFWGLGLGKYNDDRQFGNMSGILDSLVRPELAAAMRDNGAHPYQWYEAVNKVANQITTRSNVFSVWITVGFFEVKDDTTQPPKLGAEIGKTENRHVRHRMFSIVDRTNLTVATGVKRLGSAVPRAPTPGIIAPQNGTTPSGIPWSIGTGSTVIVDVGANQEVIVLRGGGAVTFTKPHAANAPVSLPNVPGEPPFFLKSVVVEPADPANPLDLWVTVPVNTANAQELTGDYDGVDWTIQPRTPQGVARTWLIIGSGADQEYVAVEQVAAVAGAVTPQGKFRVRLTRNHPEPFSIANMILGNPGPQPRFNPRQAPYSAVVRYLSIIQ